MVARRVPGLLLTTLVAVLATTSTARAWTRSIVGSAEAKIDLEDDGTAAVLLRLDLEVQAGWLQELELAELGADVVLDRARAPYFRSEDGEIFRPEAEVDDEGRIRLSFSRREAPRRGEYRVFIRYRSKVDAVAVEVEGKPYARVTWSVPAWETGLHGVSVELQAPKGASVPPESADAPAGVDLRIAEHPNRTVFEWNRVHLPRMTPWSLTVDVPGESIALPAKPRRPAPQGFKPLATETRRPPAWTLVIVALLALFKRRSIERTLGSEVLLLGVTWAPVLAVTAALVAAGQWLGLDDVLWALPLIALVVHRPISLDPSPASVPWRPCGSHDLPQPKAWIGDFLDVTTGIGLFLFGLSSMFLFAVGQPTGALLVLVLFSFGTRYHTVPGPAEASLRLRGFVSELRLPADAPPIALGWEIASGRCVRARLHLPSHRVGLSSLGFVVASRSDGFVVRRCVMLLVETRAQSDADDLVRRRLRPGTELRKSNGVIVRLVEWNTEALELVRALSRQAPKPVKTSRGTWLLHEMSEPSKKAA